MNTQHTPGPWHFEQNPHSGDILSNGLRIATVCAPSMGTNTETYPNGYLLAAAPDLLAALIDAENMLDQLRHTRVLENDTWDAIDKTVDKARAALSKAEGV